MITGNQPSVVEQRHHRGMSKARQPANPPTAPFGLGECRAKGKLTQRNHHAWLEQIEGLVEPRAAMVDLFQRRFVIGRSAVNSGRDRAIDQLQTVIRGNAIRLIGEARFV